MWTRQPSWQHDTSRASSVGKPGFVPLVSANGEDSEQPIHVRITLGSTVGELTLVGDPHDAMLGVQIGRAVSLWLIENADSESGVVS